jgi:hypothetical protein
MGESLRPAAVYGGNRPKLEPLEWSAGLWPLMREPLIAAGGETMARRHRRHLVCLIRRAQSAFNSTEIPAPIRPALALAAWPRDDLAQYTSGTHPRRKR